VNHDTEISGAFKDSPYSLHKINVPTILPKWLSFFWRYYQLKKIIGGIGLQASDTVLFVNASPLIFLNKRILNGSKLVVIQCNKVDIVFLSKISRLILYIKRNLISNVIVYTKFDKDVLLQSLSFFENKVIVIPRGCRLETRKSTSRNSKKLVAIARIQENQKNFQSMVKVMKLLPDGYTLDIFGGGSDDEISQLNVLISNCKNIKFRGPIHDVASCLSEYSIFLMTSHYEGFGQSLIEARSQGLPVVVFDTFDALPDVVAHGVTGFVVPYLDHAMFAERIIELAESPDKYEEFSYNSLKLSVNNELSYINEKWTQLFLH
jgi:glycosyltransferase involved in cell wall biosynthesis